MLIQDNKYIHILKTDVNKSNELEAILRKEAIKWVDSKKDNWTFEKEGPEEAGDFGSISGPDINNLFDDFISYLEEDTLLRNFFNVDISETEMKELCEYIADEAISLSAFIVIEETIEEEKEGFIKDYEPDPNNYPWGPRYESKRFSIRM